MKKNLIALTLMCFLAAPAFAEKPVWGGKQKPTEEQISAHKNTMEAKEHLENDDQIREGKEKLEREEKKNKSEKKERKDNPDSSDDLTGLEKQSAKKEDQTQNELDKGSDKGKESREANSKKWWKFWGD